MCVELVGYFRQRGARGKRGDNENVSKTNIDTEFLIKIDNCRANDNTGGIAPVRESNANTNGFDKADDF